VLACKIIDMVIAGGHKVIFQRAQMAVIEPFNPNLTNAFTIQLSSPNTLR